MALAVGTKLGPYEVVAAIGAGGTGEVYRARDSKPDRDLSADGQKFLMVDSGITSSPPLTLLQNWPAMLRK